MKRRTFFLFAACVLFSSSIAAEKAAVSQFAGHYVGTWKGPSETQGDLRITLKQDAAARWTAEAVFTYEGSEVPTKMKSVTVDGAKIVLVFDWKIGDTPGQSTLKGELAGTKLAGTYQTATETPSSGTWSAVRAKE